MFWILLRLRMKHWMQIIALTVEWLNGEENSVHDRTPSPINSVTTGNINSISFCCFGRRKTKRSPPLVLSNWGFHFSSLSLCDFSLGDRHTSEDSRENAPSAIEYLMDLHIISADVSSSAYYVYRRCLQVQMTGSISISLAVQMDPFQLSLFILRQIRRDSSRPCSAWGDGFPAPLQHLKKEGCSDPGHLMKSGNSTTAVPFIYSSWRGAVQFEQPQAI